MHFINTLLEKLLLTGEITKYDLFRNAEGGEKM
jgi:hypothetical protein